MSELELEAMIQERGLTAPRLTPEKIDNQIKYVEYWRVPNTTSTVCAMVLQNNFVVIGKSAAASWLISTKLVNKLHTKMLEIKSGNLKVMY